MAHRVGMIGFGYWGPILFRNFVRHAQFDVVAVCDRHQEHLAPLAAHPSIVTSTGHHAVLENPDVDLVVIATQASTHYTLAREALERGKHVFVEKPVTMALDEALALAQLAKERRRLLLVDHTFLFTPAFRRIQQLLGDGTLGRPHYQYSLRANFGPVPRDVNVLWHLLYHDIYVLLEWLGEMPTRVKASLRPRVPEDAGDIGALWLEFPGGCTALLHGNLHFPRKCQQIVLACEKKIVSWDETAPDAKKLVIFTPATAAAATIPGRPSGTEEFVPLSGEALYAEVDHLADCLSGRHEPLIGAEAACRVTRVLDAAEQSLAEKGWEISLADARAIT